MKEELLKSMSDEELVKTIDSFKLLKHKSIGHILLIQEASSRINTKNKELIEFQNMIVERVLRSIDKKGGC